MRIQRGATLVLGLLSVSGLFGQISETWTLDDVLRIALEENQSLRISKFETDRSSSQAKSNLSIILPQVDLSLSGSASGYFPALYDTTSITIPGITDPFQTFTPNGELGSLDWRDRYSLSLSLSQNIWDGGRWWNTLQSARVSQDAAEIQYQNSEIQTTYQVKLAFYNYLSTSRLLDVYRENLNTNAYQHDLTLERYRLGAASQNDTLRTLVATENSRLQVLRGETELDLRRKDLNILLGREWDAPLNLREPLWDPVDIPDLEKAVQEALSASPAIRLLEMNRDVSNYNVKIARADYIPAFRFSASYGNSSTTAGDLLTRDNLNLTTGVSLVWNLTNGTRKMRTLEQSRLSSHLASENLDLTERTLRKDLAQLLEQMETLQKTVSISVLIQDASAQDLLLAQEEYTVGSISILDVLRISDNYEDAKAGLIRARYNLKIAEAQLHQLLGRR